MFQVFKLSFLTRIPRARSASPQSGCPSRGETQKRRVLFSRVEHVERVEMFMLAARPYSSIIYSGSSIEGSDTFGHTRFFRIISHFRPLQAIIVHPSIRQVRLGIGHKLVDGVGDIVHLKSIATAILGGT